MQIISRRVLLHRNKSAKFYWVFFVQEKLFSGLMWKFFTEKISTIFYGYGEEVGLPVQFMVLFRVYVCRRCRSGYSSIILAETRLAFSGGSFRMQHFSIQPMIVTRACFTFSDNT